MESQNAGFLILASDKLYKIILRKEKERELRK